MSQKVDQVTRRMGNMLLESGKIMLVPKIPKPFPTDSSSTPSSSSQTPQQQAHQAVYQRTRPQLFSAFNAVLTRHGNRRDGVLGRVAARLRITYSHACPLELAVDALRPVIKYIRPKGTKYYRPVAIWPDAGTGIAIRWIVEAARARTYRGQRPDLERGLADELEAVLGGTSAIYVKKANMHKNPN